jgi:hypothetical protein
MAKKTKQKSTHGSNDVLKSVRRMDGWKVVCTQDGTLAEGLTKAAAKAACDAHQAESGHSTTYTRDQ